MFPKHNFHQGVLLIPGIELLVRSYGKKRVKLAEVTPEYDILPSIMEGRTYAGRALFRAPYIAAATNNTIVHQNRHVSANTAKKRHDRDTKEGRGRCCIINVYCRNMCP